MTSRAKKYWTVMIYMAADNHLYKYARVNVRQMVRCASTKEINIVVQLDGPQSDQTIRFSLRPGGQHFEQTSRTHTLDRQTRLEEFLEWCRTEHPAENYFLVFWGHGEGLDRSYVYKEPASPKALRLVKRRYHQRRAIRQTKGVLHARNANEYLKNVQLHAALNKFTHDGKKIDVLGFDSCLMGMVEIWHEIRHAVAFTVASADEIPNHSWPYHLILADLVRNPGMSPAVLSTVIVNRFLESYSKRKCRRAVTLSAVDLSGCHLLAEAVRGLANALRAHLPSSKAAIDRARREAQCFEVTEYIDLGKFCQRLQYSFANHAIGKAAEQVMNVLLRPFVVYGDHSNWKRLRDSLGVSIYFPEELEQSSAHDPATNKAAGSEGKVSSYHVIWSAYKALEFCKYTGWPGFLEDFFAAQAFSPKSAAAKRAAA